MVRGSQGKLALAALVVVAACRQPGYPVPPQKVMPPGPEPPATSMLLSMADPATDQAIVADVLGLNGTWRWTNQRPRFRVPRVDTSHWDLTADFTVPGVVLKAVGPLTLRFVVNNHVLAERTYREDHREHFQAPVDAAWLGDQPTVVIGFDVNPVYVAESDGVKLGVLLESIGLVEGR